MIKHISLAFLMLFMLWNAIAKSCKTASNTQSLSIDFAAPISYTCSMHPEITSDKPGKCPICGMELVQKAASQYTCPMHPEVLSSSPGKCPKCGMALELKSAAPYSCPMHPEITSMKPGKCSICGMQLQKTKASGNKKQGCCSK